MTAITPYNPASPAVTLVTALAQTTDLSDAEYRQIYARVAAGRSLRNVELALRSGVTFGWWAAYAEGKKLISRERKNELRRWARANGGPELPDLPPTPAEAVGGRVHADAAVYHVGEEIASRVVLIGADVPTVQLRINGNCAVADAPLTLGEGQKASQAACNSRYTRKPTKAIRISPETWNRLSAARLRSGQSWDAFLGALAAE